MPIQVDTRDCAALTDTDLDEMASMGGSFDIGVLSKAKEDWVLCTTARSEGRLYGFMFATLERIGGTPCVLIGLISVKRTSKRDQALKGLMGEAYHRALMAFPDEDVVVGSRFVRPDALEAVKFLEEQIPRPGHRAVGEERAWGRRLAKRFGIETSAYNDRSFTVIGDGSLPPIFDYVAPDHHEVHVEVAAYFAELDIDNGDVLIGFGWAMAEDLDALLKETGPF